MENNDNIPGTSRSPTKPTRSPEPRAQSPNLPYIRTVPIQDLPQHYANARFVITPESINLERSDTPTTGHEEQTMPKSEMKSYEKQFIKQSMGGNNLYKPGTLQATQSNLYTPLKQQNSPQSNSQPLSSPPALESLQSNWNPIKTPNFQQQRINCAPNFEIQQQQTYSFNEPLPRYFDSELPLTSANNPISNTIKSSEQRNMASASPSVPTADNSQCSNPSHLTLKNVTSLSEIPTSYFEQHLKKYRSGSREVVGNSSEMNGRLNDVFLKRLQEIDANAYGDINLKLITYQEWVDMLLKVNEMMIANIEELESEVAERLEIVQRKAINCRHSQGNELMKCRQDIDTLIKYIQNTCHHDNWDLRDLNLETLTTAQILGSTEQQMTTVDAEKGVGLQARNSTDAESMHKNKLFANMRALAFEVAEKHDEIRELKRQVVCMEDEIQKAQKKIHFKEDVIKELRNDLKCAHNKLNHRDSLETTLVMPPINYESQTARSTNTDLSDGKTLTDDTVTELEFLSQTVNEENLKVSNLYEELLELLALNKEWNDGNKQKIEQQRKRLKNIFQKLETEKEAAYRKLDFIRHQLTDLESDCTNDCDSGFYSKYENDQDVKILDSVRKRLRKLNDTILEQKKTMYKLSLENGELSTRLQAESNISQRNSQTLKEIADLLSGMIGQQFSYTDIYNSNNTETNPFCEVILNIKKGYQDREIEMLRTVEENNRNFQELTLALFNNEKSHGEQQRTRLNIIDLERLNNTTLPPTTPPPPIPTTSSSSAATLLTGQEHDKTTSTSLQGLKEI